MKQHPVSTLLGRWYAADFISNTIAPSLVPLIAIGAIKFRSFLTI